MDFPATLFSNRSTLGLCVLIRTRPRRVMSMNLAVPAAHDSAAGTRATVPFSSEGSEALATTAPTETM
jgi:hypothetical protein